MITNIQPDEAMPRLFVPLSTGPYLWFRSGKKTWELRRNRGAFRFDRVALGRIVELRKGYSDRSTSLWGVVRTTTACANLAEFFDRVDYRQVIPTAASVEDALATAESILSIGSGEEVALVGIEIEILGSGREVVTQMNDRPQGPDLVNPRLVMSNLYMSAVSSGRKTTTIRRKTTRYSVGPVAIVSDGTKILTRITSIQHLRSSELTDEDARSDGFDSLASLQAALRKHYPELDLHGDEVTILQFETPKQVNGSGSSMADSDSYQALDD